MNPQVAVARLHSVAFTTTTPFSRDGDEVRHDELSTILETQRDAGAELFMPCGNTGEYYSLSHEERIAVARTTVETVGDATVVAGVGGSTKTAIDLLGAYEDVGVDIAMIMHPSHAYVHQRGAVEYYEALARATDLPLVLYKRGPELSDEAIAELSTNDGIVGVKYAVNDVRAFATAVAETPGDVAWLNGLGDAFAPSFALEGAVGFTTGIGNAVPHATLALFDAVEEGNWTRARQLRDAIRPLEDLRAEPGDDNDLADANNVPVVKYCMELAGMYGGPVREPLVELADADRKRAREHFERVQEHAPGVSLADD